MPKTTKLIQSLNAGELSPLMDSRNEQQKYAAGCRTMETFVPLIYGGAQERPGLEYIAATISSSAKSRLVSFEHSVDDTYILEFGNQEIRAFKDGTRILDGVGTETTATINAAGTVVGHWTLNDDAPDANVVDKDGATYTGTATTNTETLSVTGKTGRAFNLNATNSVYFSDADAFSFTDNSNPNLIFSGSSCGSDYTGTVYYFCCLY